MFPPNMPHVERMRREAENKLLEQDASRRAINQGNKRLGRIINNLLNRTDIE